MLFGMRRLYRQQLGSQAALARHPGLLQVELLRQLRPDVVLTCLQTAHGAVLTDGLMEAALHAVLGYAPAVVHCAAEDLAGVWRDMQVSRLGGLRLRVRACAACMQLLEETAGM